MKFDAKKKVPASRKQLAGRVKSTKGLKGLIAKMKLA